MNFVVPKPLSMTTETVTLRRTDWEAHLDRLEDAADHATVADAIAERARIGDAEYTRLCYTADEMSKLLDGVSPLAIWRVRSGMTPTELAAAAGVSINRLGEMEAGREAGDGTALSRLAEVLRVPADYLVRDDPQR